MRNILRKNKERQPAAASHASSSTPAPEDQSARRPSEASSVDTQGTASETESSDGLFADDASTIRPTRSYAESFFSDTASTLHEDAYACLGPQDGVGSSSAAGASQVTLVNSTSGGPAGGGTTRVAVGGRDYRHEPRDFEPFNAFTEVARMSQRERVALAVKNSMGPQYDELYWVGTVPAPRRKSGRSG